MAMKSDLNPEDVKELGRALINKERNKTFKDVDIQREGTKIIIPKGMTLDHAIEWLMRQQKAEESEIAIHHEIQCFPLEGALALKKALTEIFGFIDLKTERSFFGEKPPVLISVPTGPADHEQAYWGLLQPPALEGGYIQTGIGSNGFTFVISGKIKRKFEPVMAAIAESVQLFVKEKSIYKGRAIRVKLDYLRDDAEKPFDVFSDGPIFMDLTNVNEDDLIMTEQTRLDLTTGVFMRIENSEDCKKNDIPLKNGILLMGPYGTGKTLTARVTASKAVKNNWTFIYLENCKDLANALRLAELYAPSVVFSEDIDKATEGGRSDELNKILNTLDGVDTKEKPIIAVLTTNHHENISRAFLRPGRIDTMIQMKAFDAETAIKFVKRFMVNEHNVSLLRDDVDIEAIGESLNDLVPAFISEVINKAKMYAISREGADVTGKVTTSDITTASKIIKAHCEIMSSEQVRDITLPLSDAEIIIKKDN